ncbi:hypothetical protein LXL04_028319 [Taraxacum kok-saghyz]
MPEMRGRRRRWEGDAGDGRETREMPGHLCYPVDALPFAVSSRRETPSRNPYRRRCSSPAPDAFARCSLLLRFRRHRRRPLPNHRDPRNPADHQESVQSVIILSLLDSDRVRRELDDHQTLGPRTESVFHETNKSRKRNIEVTRSNLDCGVCNVWTSSQLVPSKSACTVSKGIHHFPPSTHFQSSPLSIDSPSTHTTGTNHHRRRLKRLSRRLSSPLPSPRHCCHRSDLSLIIPPPPLSNDAPDAAPEALLLFSAVDRSSDWTFSSNVFHRFLLSPPIHFIRFLNFYSFTKQANQGSLDLKSACTVSKNKCCPPQLVHVSNIHSHVLKIQTVFKISELSATALSSATA